MARTATGQKPDRRIVKTRKAIDEAFQRLVTEKGLEKVTVSALAREADIDRKTFYLHFSSIDDLIAHKAEDLVDHIVHAVFDDDSGANDPLGVRLRKMLVELAAIVEQNPEMYLHLMKSFSLDQMIDALHDPVRRVAVEKDPVLAAASTEVVEFIVRFYLAGALSVFVKWFEGGRKTPVTSTIDLVEQAISSHPAFSASK